MTISTSKFITPVSRNFFYPLWDIYDRSQKLREWHRLNKNQWDSIEVKRAVQLNSLKSITDYALKNCPYYKKKGGPPLTSFESLRQWPLLEKKDIRTNVSDMLSREFSRDQLVQAKTGGSTGVSLNVYFDKKTQEKRNAVALRCDHWAGWRLGEPMGSLWGNPPQPRGWKQIIRNNFLDRLIYLDTMQMTDKSMTAFIKTVKQNEISILFGHAHSLYVLAKFIETNRLETPRLKGIISTSMMLLPQERACIERVFGVPVTNRYGCEEVGLIACECEKREGLHLNIDHLYIEFLKEDGTPASIGEKGDLVVTDLINHGMPLIRYKLGDIGVPSDHRCSCGRGLPLLKKIVGRSADFLIHQNGMMVAGVSLVERTLTAIPGIEQMQIVQRKLDEVQIFVVPDSNYSMASEDRLLRELKIALGFNMTMKLKIVTHLMQEGNGKFRFAICQVGSRYQEGAFHA